MCTLPSELHHVSLCMLFEKPLLEPGIYLCWDSLHLLSMAFTEFRHLDKSFLNMSLFSVCLHLSSRDCKWRSRFNKGNLRFLNLLRRRNFLHTLLTIVPQPLIGRACNGQWIKFNSLIHHLSFFIKKLNALKEFLVHTFFNHDRSKW